ncbi:MAG: hypothetical protein ACOZDY_18530 [Pseudomonadota bacterium]
MCTGLEIIGSFFAANAGTIAAVGAGLSAINTISQGQQQKRFHNFQAQQAAADAQAEREAGEVRADRIRRQVRAQVGQATAALGASGVSSDAGTPVKIVQDIETRGEFDALAEILAGGRIGAKLDQAAAGHTASGRNALRSATIGAGASLLATGADLYGPGWKTGGTNPDKLRSANFGIYGTSRSLDDF